MEEQILQMGLMVVYYGVKIGLLFKKDKDEDKDTDKGKKKVKKKKPPKK